MASVEEHIHHHDIELTGIKKDISTFGILYQKIDNTVIKLETKFEEHSEKITESISAMKRELIAELNSMKTDTMTEINSMKKESNDRIRSLELWRSLLIGGAVIIGLIVSTAAQSIIHKAINPSQTTVQVQQPPQPPPPAQIIK